MKQVASIVALLASMLCISPALASQQPYKNVEQLNDSNFQDRVVNVEKDSIWLVTFFLPWCVHAKQFEPEYDSTVERLRSQGYKINFGAVDVSVNPNIGRYYNINSSPIVKVFYHDGTAIEERNYLGERNSDSLYNYCQNFYKQKNLSYSNMPAGFVDGSVVVLDDDNFDDVIYSSNEIWVIKFGAPWCHHCKLMIPAQEAAAQALGSKIRIAEIDADANRGLARRFGVSKLPTIKYFKAGYGKNDERALPYTGGRSEYDLKTFGSTLWNEYIENPELFTYVPETCDPSIDEFCDPSSHSEFDCGIENCEDLSHNHHHHHHDHGVPEMLQNLCDKDDLCIVAFLQLDRNHEERVGAMTKMATKYEGKNVKFFWLERGSEIDCENALRIAYLKNPVIGFTGSKPKFVTMQSDLTEHALQDFVNQIEREGLDYGRSIPDGEIRMSEL